MYGNSRSNVGERDALYKGPGAYEQGCLSVGGYPDQRSESKDSSHTTRDVYADQRHIRDPRAGLSRGYYEPIDSQDTTRYGTYTDPIPSDYEPRSYQASEPSYLPSTATEPSSQHWTIPPRYSHSLVDYSTPQPHLRTSKYDRHHIADAAPYDTYHSQDAGQSETQNMSFLGFSTTSYRGEQNDDDFQRGNARHHRLDDGGQDRFRQQGASASGHKELYAIAGEERRKDGLYCRLRGIYLPANYDGTWVSARDVIFEKTTGFDKVVRVRNGAVGRSYK